jgi:hypothetical protein
VGGVLEEQSVGALDTEPPEIALEVEPLAPSETAGDDDVADDGRRVRVEVDRRVLQEPRIFVQG